jgi:drug/metabolite transporter (DMT)-like permease
MALVGSSVAVSRTLGAAPLFTAQAVRYALAGLVLLALARRLRVPVRRPRGPEWLWLAGIAATGLVAFNVAIVRGTAHAQPTMIAVAVACVPVLLGVIGPLMQGQRPRSQVVTAAVVVTIGAAAVEGAGHADALGLAWAALALACEAAFTLLAVPVLTRHGPWGVSVHAVWLGAAMFTVLGLATEGPSAVTRLTGPDLLAVCYLAILVTVAAFVLWYSAVAALGPGRSGLIAGVAPVAAALAGIILGSRAPSLAMWAGIAVVVAGLAAGLRVPARLAAAGEVDPLGRLAPADKRHGRHLRREQAVVDHPGRGRQSDGQRRRVVDRAVVVGDHAAVRASRDIAQRRRGDPADGGAQPEGQQLEGDRRVQGQDRLGGVGDHDEPVRRPGHDLLPGVRAAAPLDQPAVRGDLVGAVDGDVEAVDAGHVLDPQAEFASGVLGGRGGGGAQDVE